jgi:hypothetical protein
VGLLALACQKKEPSEPPKKSPNELIGLLAKGGATVEKAGSFNNEPPAEMNMQLKVDGTDGFVATRFPQPKLASDYCETQAACFTIEHWSVEALPSAAKSAQWKALQASVESTATKTAASP